MLIFQTRQLIFFSHTLHLFLCLSTDGSARIYLIYLFENARTPFLCVSVRFFFLTPIPEKEKNHLNRHRPRESNPVLLRGKQVRYPLHHCLSVRAIIAYLSNSTAEMRAAKKSNQLSFYKNLRLIPPGLSPAPVLAQKNSHSS